VVGLGGASAHLGGRERLLHVQGRQSPGVRSLPAAVRFREKCLSEPDIFKDGALPAAMDAGNVALRAAVHNLELQHRSCCIGLPCKRSLQSDPPLRLTSSSICCSWLPSVAPGKPLSLMQLLAAPTRAQRITIDRRTLRLQSCRGLSGQQWFSLIPGKAESFTSFSLLSSLRAVF
jgi:hypothetical protein